METEIVRTQIEKNTPAREVHFDGFKDWFTTEGPDLGHYIGTLWTYNDRGERVEVEVHLHSKDTNLDKPYSERVAICKRIMQGAYKELMEKVKS